MFNMRTAEVQASSSAGQTTNFTEEVMEVNAAQQQNSVVETVSDNTYGEYEKGKVLLLVNDATDLEAVNAVLENTDFAETKNVSDQDISAGFVSVAIDSSTPMSSALSTLAEAGLKAQPNYIYSLTSDEETLEADNDSSNLSNPGSAASEATDSLATEDPREGSMESAAADDSEDAADSTDTPQAPKNDLATMSQLLTAVTTGEGFIASSDMDAAAAVSVNDPGISSQWMLKSMRVYEAWGIAKCREGSASPKVSVAVIDTGCFTAHEDLAANIKASYNSYSDNTGLDNVQDENGHGTHVAGIVSADANNGKGVAGVSYNAGLVIIKASFKKTDGTTGNFSTETLADAYGWLLGKTNTGIQTNAEASSVRVVNMSLGGHAGTDPLATDHVLYTNITKAKEQGILTVCAAGNEFAGKELPYTCIPSDYADCFTVINLANSSSGTKNDPSGSYEVSPASTSNYNLDGTSSKSISAPGTSIYNTINTGSYGYKGGTSMASPGVAGVAALMFAYDPTLSVSEARSILEQTAKDIGATGWDLETGYGEVDAYRALQILSAEISGKSVLASDDKNVPLELFCTDGTALEADEWNWTSSDPNVLAVDPNTGAVSAVGPGTATVTATNKAIASRSITKEVSVGVDLNNVTVTLTPNVTYTYNGSEHRPTVLSVTTADGDPLTLGVDYRVVYSDNVNAGSGKITILPGENSTNVTNSKEVLFEIKPASIAGINVPTIPDQTYTGNPVTPYGSILLDYGQTRLIRGVDYDVTFSDNVDANLGLATATITGKGNYTGTLEANFNILCDFSQVKITVDDQEYSGKPITAPRIRATFNGNVLSGDAPGDYEIVSFENNIEPGTASVTLRGRGIYKATEQKVDFNITKYDFKNGLDISTIQPQDYTGKEVRPTLKVSFNGNALVPGQDYNVYYSNNINSGTEAIARIVAVSNSKYFTGETSTTFTIKSQSFAGKTSMDNFKEELTYKNGEILTQNIDLYLIDDNGNRKEKLEPGTHYRVWYRETGSNLSVSPTGDAKKDKYYEMVIVGLEPYYSGTVVREFKIKAPTSSNSSGSNSNSSTNNSGNNNSNNSTTPTTPTPDSSGATTVTTQSLPSAPTVTGTWKKSGSRWWFQLDAKSQASLKNGKNYPYNQWVTIGGKRYHFDGSGWMHANWQQLSSKWYYFGSDGAMKTGWQKVGGKWYYMASDGIMQTGKKKLSDGKTYYLNPTSGAMKTGWNSESGTWYYYNSSGAMVKGWVKSGSKWYHMNNSSGAMDVNWFTDTDGKKYFLLSSSGQMLTGWVKIDSVWYYFNGSGVMQKSKWIGNYYVDANGKMLTSQWVGNYWVGADGKWTGARR